MGGAQPLAATMAGASMLARRMPAEPHRAPAGDALCRRARRRRSTRPLAMHREPPAPGAKPVSVGLLGNAAEVFPEIVKRRSRTELAARRGHRPDLAPMIPSTAICRRAGRLDQWERSARQRPDRRGQGGEGHRWPCRCAPCSSFHGMGIPTARLRQQHPPDGAGGRA